MEIVKGIEIVDLGLFINAQKTLIVGDIHIGCEEAMNKQGILVPRFQLRDLITRFDNIFKKIQPEKIIINGDLKHEFGSISNTEWRNTLKLIDFLAQIGKVLLLKGNHDKILEQVTNKRNIEVREYYCENKLYICHGHKIPADPDFKKSIIVLIGHDHPAICLRDRGRVEKYKCFLRGKYKGKALIVMPSFDLTSKGTDLSKEKTLSPFLDQNIRNFEVYIVEEDVYYFGKLGKLIR